MTRPRTPPTFALLLLLAFAVPAWSDCPDWVPGLLDDGGPNDGANAAVECILPFDPDGAGPLGETLAMAGAFTTVEGQPAKYLAMRNPTTGRWEGMGEVAGTSGYNALAVFNGELIAGGGGDIDPLDRDDNILRWDGAAWQSMGGGTNTGTVRVLHVHNGVLYAAGNFVIERPMQSPISHIAKWNPSSEEWEPLNGALTGGSSSVNAMITYGADLVVGGNFLVAGGLTVNGVAKYNGSAWSAMGAGMSGGGVGVLQVYLGTVYIGGNFNSSNGVTTGGFARWNGTNWVPAGTIFPGQVHTLGVHAGQLLLGGSFVHTAQNLEQYNGGAYSSVGGAGMGIGPNCFLSSGGILYMGGFFSQVGSITPNNVAQWDGLTWLPLGGGVAGQVRAFTNYLGRFVVAGGFDQSAEPGLPAHNIAAWDGSRLWSYEEGTNGVVLSLESHKYPGTIGSYELIAGGLFTTAGSVAANRIARWNERPIVLGDDPEWEAMGAGFNNGVYAIERHASATYAGGTFTASGATTVNRIARWNETSDAWEPMGTGMNGTVYALKSFGGLLYAGGSFTTAGGVSTGGLARWNGTSWSPVGLGFGGIVYALEIHNNALVIAGSFPGGGSPNLSSWTGSLYSNPAPGGTNGEVFAVHSFGGVLYLGGSFSSAGGVQAARVASYGPGGWFEIADGVDDNVFALMNYGGEVNAGGWFGTVRDGTLASPRWARYSPTGLPWVARNPSGQTIAVGGNASFTSQVVPGTSPMTLRWHYYDRPLKNGVTNHGSTVSGVTTTTLQIANISGYDVGEYRLVAWSECGSDTSATARLDLPYTTGVPPVAALPTAFEAIAPNPTLGSSVLMFTLERDANVRMRVHDVRGRVVRTIDIGRLPAGRHQTPWNARASAGAGSAIHAGIYFVRLEVDGRPIGTKRLAVL